MHFSNLSVMAAIATPYVAADWTVLEEASPRLHTETITASTVEEWQAEQLKSDIMSYDISNVDATRANSILSTCSPEAVRGAMHAIVTPANEAWSRLTSHVNKCITRPESDFIEGGCAPSDIPVIKGFCGDIASIINKDTEPSSTEAFTTDVSRASKDTPPRPDNVHVFPTSPPIQKRDDYPRETVTATGADEQQVHSINDDLNAYQAALDTSSISEVISNSCEASWGAYFTPIPNPLSSGKESWGTLTDFINSIIVAPAENLPRSSGVPFCTAAASVAKSIAGVAASIINADAIPGDAATPSITATKTTITSTGTSTSTISGKPSPSTSKNYAEPLPGLNDWRMLGGMGLAAGLFGIAML